MIKEVKNMGLFDAFKKISAPSNSALTYAQILSRADTIDESEKKYYQPDSYYSDNPFRGTQFDKEVITFEKRIETSLPSSTGLYVPEILMLHFCKNFPNPKNGYPAYWWFKYGVRNVGAMLNSLEKRGYIEIDPQKGKYRLTEKGKKEESENEYVYYVHSKSQNINFTAWTMNELLGTGNKRNYLAIIQDMQAKAEAQSKVNEQIEEQKFKETFKFWEKADPKIAKDLQDYHDQTKEENECLSAYFKREAQYKEDKDIKT